MSMEGKVVIVTGGAGGIGLATAQSFGKRGARVIVVDYAATKADAAVQALQAAGVRDALALACNVGVEAEVVRAVDATIAHFGQLDIVVNNAGTMIFKPIEAHSEEDLLGIFRVDFFGAFWFIKQAFLKCRPGSAVVNVASIHAVETTPLVSAYAAAKVALVSLTRSAAIEGKPKGIRVNVVLPGAIDTPMLRENPNVKSGAEVVDPAFVGQPQDVASAIVYLASDQAAFVNGAPLIVDGGRLACL
ncbi:MAG: SDR family oxidoreductase [Pseudomonadota bacterium]|nr:SDR family oxidoreductase [Pseudomonadota bacterium]